jgi:hypothetical protein
MSDTETAPTKGQLFQALAKLQAELPKIGKGGTAQYGKYADLADVSKEVLPRLGSLGLAFTAKPTMADGSFVLAYSLVHVSGEREDGFYPLPSNGTSQQLGSAITYARRYALCAVTGVAPDEDDDGAAAQDAPWQGRGDRDRSTPARSQRQGGNGQQRNQGQRPAAAQQPQAAQAGLDDVDEGAQALADEAYQALAMPTLEGIHRRAREAGKVNALVRNPASGKTGKLALYLNWRRQQIKEMDDALADLTAAASEREIADLDGWFKTATGMALDDASASQMRDAAKILREQKEDAA